MKTSLRPDKEFAAKNGIPEWLRRYAKRYGVQVEDVARIQMQTMPRIPPVGIDHG